MKSRWRSERLACSSNCVCCWCRESCLSASQAGCLCEFEAGCFCEFEEAQDPAPSLRRCCAVIRRAPALRADADGLELRCSCGLKSMCTYLCCVVQSLLKLHVLQSVVCLVVSCILEHAAPARVPFTLGSRYYRN